MPARECLCSAHGGIERSSQMPEGGACDLGARDVGRIAEVDVLRACAISVAFIWHYAVIPFP